MFLPDYFLACEISTVRTQTLRPPQTSNFYRTRRGIFCFKRQKSLACGRQRRVIFVARDENEKLNMFDIYNNGQGFLSLRQKLQVRGVWRFFLEQGTHYR